MSGQPGSIPEMDRDGAPLPGLAPALAAREGIPPAARVHPYLCVMVTAILGFVGLVGVAGVVVLAMYGHSEPPSLVALTTLAVTALAHYLALSQVHTQANKMTERTPAGDAKP